MMKKKDVRKFSTMILLFGACLDFLAYQGMSLISVNENYIYYVHTTITTVGAISTTILTIIVNSFAEKFYGFSIKEIANFNNEYFKGYQIIHVALLSILISAIVLALGFINTLVAILVIVVSLILSVNLHTWKLISDDQFCLESVLREIDIIVKRNKAGELENLFKRLFRSLNHSIVNYGILHIDTYLDMILEAIKKSKITDDLVLLMHKEIKNTFNKASVSIGFIPAIDKVLTLYNFISLEYSHYDKREIFFEQIQNIQFLNEKELSTSTMIRILNGLEDQVNLYDSEKVFILYQYFKNIYHNELINTNLKNELLENLIAHVSSFHYSAENNYDIVKQKVLLYIVRDFVLANKKIEYAREILIKISEVFYFERDSENDKLFETAAIIYLVIYLYSEFETETLAAYHRKQLKSLIHAHRQDIHINKISFEAFLKTCFKQIVKALWNLSEQSYEDMSFLEYFHPQTSVKSVVWDIRAGINFAIFNYLLSYYEFGTIPYKAINNWDELENKRFYITSFLDFFDAKTQIIKESRLEKMKEISEWVGIRESLSFDVQKEIFRELNKEMQLLENKDLEGIVDYIPKISEINNLLRQQFTDFRHFYGYNESIDIKNAKKMTFERLIVDLEYCNNELNISARFIRYFESFINGQVKKKLPTLQLSFDLEGIKELLIQLKDKSFDKRNYTYIDDWAIGREVRETEEYKELAVLIKDITLEETKPINSHVFFQEGCLDYYIEIVDYKHELLSDYECSDYVENFKVGEGLYKIKDAYLNKSKAMEIVKKYYRNESISFKYNSNMDRGCGIRIGFKTYRQLENKN